MPTLTGFDAAKGVTITTRVLLRAAGVLLTSLLVAATANHLLGGGLKGLVPAALGAVAVGLGTLASAQGEIAGRHHRQAAWIVLRQIADEATAQRLIQPVTETVELYGVPLERAARMVVGFDAGDPVARRQLDDLRRAHAHRLGE